jgi:hypothetical protein
MLPSIQVAVVKPRTRSCSNYRPYNILEETTEVPIQPAHPAERRGGHFMSRSFHLVPNQTATYYLDDTESGRDAWVKDTTEDTPI